MFKRKTLNKLALAVVLAIPFWDMILAYVTTPIRCEMWKNRELEVTLSPEEWRKATNVSFSLKESEWVYYPILDSAGNKEFLLGNIGKYDPDVYGKESLLSVNNFFPYLGIYTYDNGHYLGHRVSILYDNFLKKEVARYNDIYGYYQIPFFKSNAGVNCKNLSRYFVHLDLLETYLY
ncbi:hypothetical protein BMT54_08855 [Pasteurellaceae bacterium 15-036681]|nr:hypothetical protein BMT54_08855 [Pasteurellaceae bacterium 15-036681]